MATTVSTKDDLTRALRSLGLDVNDVLSGLPDQVVVMDRKQRIVAEFGRETFGLRMGPLHEHANLRALQGEHVTYEWDGQKDRLSLRLSTVVAPLRNPASRIVGLVAVTRNVSSVAAGSAREAGPARQQARQLLVLEQGVRELTEVIESYRTPTVSYQLSAREQDVLHLLREGYRPRSIAEILHLSPQTVRNHLKAIFRKTGTHSQEQLIMMARRAPASGTE
jgi:DNA-binding CsgD family transcriptional regulator